MTKYIIAIDQGTTSCRVILFDRDLQVVSTAQQEYPLEYPKDGWVEANAVTIWKLQEKLLKKILAQVNPKEVAAIGMTNQRETTVVWDKMTGEPIYNAIIWQDQRTSSYCQELKKDKKFVKQVKKTTGLVIDSYFSATKLRWIINEIKPEQDILFGTIDTWLLWNLTKGKIHATDTSNASRTLLFDINTLQWSDDLLAKFEIDKTILPNVLSSNSDFGYYQYNDCIIPIRAILGDQQAALFGQNCFSPGTVKNTYGTGCFMLMNTGNKPIFSSSGMLSTIAWTIDNQTTYALEGSVFVAGSAIQWLRDNLEFFTNSSETEKMAKASQVDGLYFVPAFSGLGAPFWDMDARGTFFGITRQVTKNDMIRATLESVAWRTRDIIFAMSNDAEIPLKNLLVDGGASANNYMMQFQSDILGIKVERPSQIESTALGAAKLAGCGVGFWDIQELMKMKSKSKVFEPNLPEEERERKYKRWLKAIELTQQWSNE